MRMHRLVESLWIRHRLAVLLITHDVDEAILLADRADVLEKGRLVASIPINLPRPRQVGQPGFLDLRKQLLRAIGVHEPTCHETFAVPDPEHPSPEHSSAAHSAVAAIA
jgi:sulfonate transport system ATP-binding protein